MAFSLVSHGALKYLTAPNIAVSHAFTTRCGGVSEGYLDSLNIGMHRGDSAENVRENYRILENALGFSVDRMVMTWQIHSDIVRAVTEADAGKGIDHHAYPQCDALITDTPHLALTVFGADCTTILLQDCKNGAVGAIHAGWRGTASKIAAKTVLAMREAYGCQPENIRAAIGPNIGMCCFETDADVPQAMTESYGSAARECIREQDEKFYVNLTALNALALREVGVENIESAALCTACHPELLWSHRKTGGHRGAQGAIIVCKGEVR